MQATVGQHDAIRHIEKTTPHAHSCQLETIILFSRGHCTEQFDSGGYVHRDNAASRDNCQLLTNTCSCTEDPPKQSNRSPVRPAGRSHWQLKVHPSRMPVGKRTGHASRMVLQKPDPIQRQKRRNAAKATLNHDFVPAKSPENAPALDACGCRRHGSVVPTASMEEIRETMQHRSVALNPASRRRARHGRHAAAGLAPSWSARGRPLAGRPRRAAAGSPPARWDA